ncbi:redoxin family protein [Lutibacter sp.]|uniref:redoxin family protein n=1 Tax=Lutibacter sp. TaxID=1925666 RepID=UPI0025C67688|nr:redoxin family protein [Lutibacter sp.]
MKKLIVLFGLFLIVSCKKEVTDYVKLEGKLNAEGIEKLTVQGKNFIKEISVNADGTFSDTLKVTDGVHAISNGSDRITLYLKNGYDLKLDFKGKALMDGIKFSGVGSETNNFMENKRNFFMSDYANPKTYFTLEKEAFDARMAEAKSKLTGFKSEVKDLDSLINAMDLRNDEMFFGYIESNYEKMHEDIMRFAKGKVSPTFENYENFNGGKTSLSDLKGKYVYIDVWATWCAPCKAEIPFLKTLEKEYHGKNIQFVSISVDMPDFHEAWKEMVKKEELGGIQLYADKNFESKFIVDYGINAIPRFILLDPNGNIVDSDAERPSSPKLKELFTELGI